MKAEFDLSKMQSRKNAYAAKLKKPVSMRLPEDVVDYFKGIAHEAGVPYRARTLARMARLSIAFRVTVYPYRGTSGT